MRTAVSIIAYTIDKDLTVHVASSKQKETNKSVEKRKYKVH